MPYAALIYNRKKKYESRTRAILQQYGGRYVAIHVSAQAASHKEQGCPTAEQIVLASGLRRRVMRLPRGFGPGQVVAIVKLGSTRHHVVPRAPHWHGYHGLHRRIKMPWWSKRFFACEGRSWERATFVAAHRLGTCFMSRILEVHALETPVCIERGYVFVHTVALHSTTLPPTIDRVLLRKCHELETARTERLLYSSKRHVRE